MQGFVISPGFLVVTYNTLYLTLVICRGPDRDMHCARHMGCAKIRTKDDASILIRVFTGRIVECGCNTRIRRCDRRSSTRNTTIQPVVSLCSVGVRGLHLVGGNCVPQQSVEYLQYKYRHANGMSHLLQRLILVLCVLYQCHNSILRRPFSRIWQ